jgi:hypothetical protein
VGTSRIPASSTATVEWIAEDLADGPAQFTVVNRHLITTDQTTDSTTDVSVRWAVSIEGTLVARGASATLDGAGTIALAVTRGIADPCDGRPTSRRTTAE